MGKLPFKQLKKRDGRLVEFEPERIKLAIEKALKAVGTANQKIAKTICDDVLKSLEEYENKIEVPDLELIQDLVENSFVRRGLTKAAKAFILYRAQHLNIRKSREVFMDIQDLVGTYLDRDDWRVNENSNAGYSFASLLNHISGSVVANYTLENVYPKEIAEAHTSGDFHIHDLSCGIVGYCAGWSLRLLLTEGFRGREGRASAGAAKHFDTALGQIVNFMCTLQTEWAGAQAFSSFDTLLAPFIREDNLDFKKVKQTIQQFVFGLNIASRWGQTPFTNLTFDWVVPDDLSETPIIIGGKIQEGKYYGDYQKEMDMINRAFLEIMTDGDRDGRVFTFPIPTYNITEDFNWETDNAKLLFEVTGKYGLPYFQNFINSDLNPSDVRSMCCRLQMDVRELRNKTGGLFGSGEQKRNVLFVKDAVQALIQSSQADNLNGMMLLAVGDSHFSVAEIAQNTVKYIGAGDVVFVDWPKDRELIEVGDAIISNKKIKALINWKPEYTLQDGLMETKKYFESCLNKYLR